MNDLWSLERRIGYPLIQEVAPSPDGQYVAYVVRQPLMTDDRSEFISHLFLATVAKAPSPGRQLTHGDHRNYGVQWSPDGQHLAFLSTRSGKANLYALSIAGGEARALTRCERTDVRAAKWAPGGAHLAALMVEPPDEAKERARKAKDDARVEDQEQQYAHLFLVPFSPAADERSLLEPRQLTRGPRTVLAFDWFPDGARIAFSHRPMPEWKHWTETWLAIVDVPDTAARPFPGTQPSPLLEGVQTTVTDVAQVGDWTAKPLVSPNCQWIACHTTTRPGKWALAGRVGLYPVQGGDPRLLAETPDGKCDPIAWSDDGETVYAFEQTGVTTQVWALPASGAPGRAVTHSTRLKSALAASLRSGGRIAFVGQDFHEPNAVCLLDTETAREVVVAQPPLPPEWPEAPLPRAEVVQWQSRDDRTIEGTLIYPLSYREGERVPLVVEVHGGPPGVFTRGFVVAPERFADAAALAARGCAILRPNPRGSTGYGRDFRFANYGDWGGGDFQDVMAGVDALVERGIVDPERLAILGWSYGGFLTSSAITQTTRFKAACVGAGVTSLMSFNGTADIPDFIPDYLGAEFWDDPETYARHSPMMHVKAVRTPTLILHGEEDVRVPVTQGRELYNALSRLGVPTELVLYPREGHMFGEPRHLLDRSRRVLAWFARWLNEVQSPES